MSVPDNPNRDDLHATTIAMLQTADDSSLTPAILSPILLRDGKRTAHIQALLRARWLKHSEFGAPFQNYAALPGQSYHEYGVAIDVIKENALKLKAALEAAGFNQDDYEEWHFTASASSHVPAVNKRMKDLVARSNQFETDLRKSFQAKQKLIPLKATMDKEVLNAKVLQENIKLLDADIKTSKKELTALNSQAGKLKDAALKAEIALQSAELKLSSHLQEKCPQGYDYNSCVTHIEWKQQFLVKKTAIEKQIKLMKAEFTAKQANYQAIEMQLDAKQKSFDNLTGQKKSKAVELAKATQKVAKLKADVKKIEDSRNTINAVLAALVAEIDAQLTF